MSKCLRKIITVWSLFLACIFFYLPELQAALPPYEGSEIKVGIPHAIELLDPALVENVEERQAASLIFEPLFRSNGRDTESLLVYKYEVENDGKNLRAWLKPELTFSDGSRLTVKDVLKSYERILTASFGSPYYHYLFPLKGAEQFYLGKTDVLAGFEIVSELEFVLHFEVRVKEAVHWLSHPALSIIPERQARSMLPVEQAVGTGPYKVNQKNSYVTELKAREDYHGGRAFLDKISFVLIDEKEKERKSLLKGEVDGVLYGRLYSEKGFKRSFSTMGADVLIRSNLMNKLQDQQQFLKYLIDCKNVVGLFETRRIKQIAGSKKEPVFGDIAQPDSKTGMFFKLLKNKALYSCDGFNQNSGKAKQIYKRLFNARPLVLKVGAGNKELELVAQRIALLAAQDEIPLKINVLSKTEMVNQRKSEDWDFELVESPSVRLSFSEIKDERANELVFYRLSAGLLTRDDSLLKGVAFDIWGMVRFDSVSGSGK